MTIQRRRLEFAAAACTSLGAIAVLFSIAASQILFAIALVALLLTRRKILIPANLLLPLACFLGWTVLSLAFSDAPLTGLSQLRKLVLFSLIPLTFTVYRSRDEIRFAFLGLAFGASVTSAYGLVQFVKDYYKLTRDGLPFYSSYVAHQISGFMSHWLTFGGELMLVLVSLLALLIFLPSDRIPRWWWVAVPLIVIALLLSFTRGIWIAAMVGVTYLLGRSKRPILCLLLPVVILVLYLFAPSWLQQREKSIFNVKTDSSNRARIVMLHTGLAMISKHPIFGVGPERVGPEFMIYKPANMPLPDGWYGHLHNNYLQIAAERGIPCLLLMMWLLVAILIEGWKCTESARAGTRAMGHCVIAVTISLMTGGLFEFNFGDSEVLMLFLYLTTASLAWTQLPGGNTGRTATIELPLPAN